jgi:two-component system, NtrC family, nitrogen regulation response regulator NtrX
MTYEILVVDDEKDIRDLIVDILEDEAYTVRTASSALGVFEMLEEKIPHAVILDIWLQGSELDGLGILEIIKKKYPYVPVIMISGHGTIETSVNSIKLGAYDYIEKPFNEDKLLVLVKRACEVGKLEKENRDLKSQIDESNKFIGNSNKAQQLKSIIEKVAPTASRILISGEPGSGKKLVASLIHKKSNRKNEVFATFLPAGLSDEKARIELFGENFTGRITAAPRKVGLLELANKGTLFIEELADLSLSMQSILLNFLQNQTLIKANGKSLKLDVRIIASTNKNIQDLIRENKFRSDLYYRVNVVPIEMPSLRDRKEDIPILADYFLAQLNERCGFTRRKLAPSAIAVLQTYAWPGNIRQLKNILEWVLIMHNQPNDSMVDAKLLPSELLANNNSSNQLSYNHEIMTMPLRRAREIFEAEYLKSQLNRFNGNITKMAESIGMERSALHRKLKTLGVFVSAND